MKQHFLFTACVAITVLAIAFFNLKNKRIEDAEEMFFMDNIEALSSSEDLSADPEVVKCYCKHNWINPNVCVVGGSGGYCGGDPCANHDGNCR